MTLLLALFITIIPFAWVAWVYRSLPDEWYLTKSELAEMERERNGKTLHSR